jgi:hypothetical protein
MKCRKSISQIDFVNFKEPCLESYVETPLRCKVRLGPYVVKLLRPVITNVRNK